MVRKSGEGNSPCLLTIFLIELKNCWGRENYEGYDCVSYRGS